MKVSAPGNIILLGEYAVLEEGGLGVACAVNRRVRLEARPASDLFVEGVWPGGSFTWTPRGESPSPVVSAVFEIFGEWKRQRKVGDIPGMRVRIDSSELFLWHGRKAGFGSSAAVAVALVIAFRAYGRLDAARGLSETVEDQLDATSEELALAAHRLAQGGVGSGYDVYCSFFGGWGMFQGGAVPTWKPHKPFADARLYLFPGPAAVSTRDAIRSFLQWKYRNARRARRLIDESNDNVTAFLGARSVREAATALRKARVMATALGDEIGVEARIHAPAGIDPDLCKALGAGNELGAYLQLPGAPEPQESLGLTLVEVAARGAVWEP